MLRFIELAGGPAARIVFIPTAAEAADQDEVDEDLDFFRQQRLASLTVLHTRYRQLADDPDFIRPLENATGVWMGGGCQRLLVDVYGQTSVERELQKLLPARRRHRRHLRRRRRHVSADDPRRLP